MAVTEPSTPSRRLASALEPVIGQVYFSPEAHANYVALGFDPSPGVANGVALPDGPAYFTSRGSMLGQVPGEVVAAGFAVFSPAAVVPCVDIGWSHTDAATIFEARQRGAVDQLRRILGDSPEGLDRANELLATMAEHCQMAGRSMSAGLQSWPRPEGGLDLLFRLGDLLREYRGDCHNAAWLTAGLSACQIGIVSELWWGLPARSYSRTRAWTEAEFDAATTGLVERGWVADNTLTDTGRAGREAIEAATDLQMEPVLAAIDSHLDELVAILAPWGDAVRAAGGYLPSGPHDLAGR